MNIKIVNVYNDKALPHKGFQAGAGESFHITIDNQQVLFDVGWQGAKLMHNLRKLKINPDEIDKLVLSHSHFDHTGGLPALLNARTALTPIPLIAHPAVLEPNFVNILGVPIPVGFPALSKDLRKKVEFKLTKHPVEVLPKLFTTGEITPRPEKPGTGKHRFHKVEKQQKKEPFLDDLALVLQIKDGLVIILGCCHAGLLNTCAKVTNLFPDRIQAILGGTHMRHYSRPAVEHVAEALKNRYGTPKLYLNHCTGKKTIKQLKQSLGSEVVRDCSIGTELLYQA